MEAKIVSRQNLIAWYIDCRNIEDQQWPQLLGLLNPKERERANKFYFDHDRKSYIAAHAISRAMLGLFTDNSPQKIEFCIGKFGKPEVILPKNLPRLRVNLSHTRHMIAVALTEEHDVGIDIEWLGRNESCLSLAEKVFTDEEQAILKDAAENYEKEIFLTLWTLKEAYIKSIGKGLSLPLTDFHFSLDPLAIHFKQHHKRNNINDSENWYLTHFRPSPEHIAAIAVQGVSTNELECKIEPVPLSIIAEKFFSK